MGLHGVIEVLLDELDPVPPLSLVDNHQGVLGVAHAVLLLGQAKAPWDGEGGVDPAVEVHGSPGHSVSYAIDGVPKVLPEGDQAHGGEQDEEGGPVVELEGEVVYGRRVLLTEELLQGADYPV